MRDAESKVALLSYYVEGIARIACSIPDDYLARLYGRSLFLGVDAFLQLAPRVKNEMRRDGRLSVSAGQDLTERINRLREDYEGYYATVRDRVSAHQQEVDLVLLFETWNEIDEATLRILAQDVIDVWSTLRAHGSVSSFARPTELDDPSTLDAFSKVGQGRVETGARVGISRVSITQPHTVTVIPTGLFQEKAMRVVTGFTAFQELVNSGIERATAQWLLPQKATTDLLVVDTCSVIDNIFEDRPATPQVSAEESLINIWTNESVKGTAYLQNFRRDASLEAQLREARNKVSAHLDPDVPLEDLIGLLYDLPMQNVSDYLSRLWVAFREACQQDIRTRMFLIHGQTLKGVVGTIGSDAIKPFRT